MKKIKNTKTLFRPVGPKELELIKESGYVEFPPRLPEQPIFYPVMNKQYAVQITEEWNVPAYGAGYVVEFDVDSDYLKKFEVQNVGAEVHDELWIPSEELNEFNSNIIGIIRVTHVKKQITKKMFYDDREGS
jgi:hypothetical protein